MEVLKDKIKRPWHYGEPIPTRLDERGNVYHILPHLSTSNQAVYIPKEDMSKEAAHG